MKIKKMNAGNKKVLKQSLKRQGKSNFEIKTLNRATKNSAGVYKVTFKKKK